MGLLTLVSQLSLQLWSVFILSPQVSHILFVLNEAKALVKEERPRGLGGSKGTSSGERLLI